MGKSILLYVNNSKSGAQHLANVIADFCLKKGWEVTHSVDLEPPYPVFSLVITLGGDGTVLGYVAKDFYQEGVAVLPIHLGTLGYIAETTVDNWQKVLLSFFNGEVTFSRRTLLDVRHYNQGRYAGDYRALNELVINGHSSARLVWLDLYLSNFHFPLRADGLIIATPTGSTAYSVAAGGPIIHPEIEALVFTPICPFSLATRPVVFPFSESVSIVIGEKYPQEKAVATVDGCTDFYLEKGDVVEIYQGLNPLLLVSTPYDRNFFPIISSKLGWRGELSTHQ